MKTIAMIGFYSEDVLPVMQQKKPKEFNIVSVPSYEEYDRLVDADYIILRGLKINADTIKTLKKARLIQRWGAGFDSVDIEAAGRAGIPVAITSGVNSAAVSELAVLLMLSLFRHVVTLDNMLKRGEWERQAYIDRSFLIKGKTVGLFGCGNIGRQVAQKVRAFGAKVLYYDSLRMPAKLEQELGICYAEQDELLALSDIVSVHVPALDSTRGVFNKAMFEKMKPTAIFINSARGCIVNEEDLVEALQQGRIAGAGLDSFVNEPLLTDSAITKCPNVVLTPHIGGNTQDINGEMVEKILSNIGKIDQGEALYLPDLVNGQFLR